MQLFHVGSATTYIQPSLRRKCFWLFLIYLLGFETALLSVHLKNYIRAFRKYTVNNICRRYAINRHDTHFCILPYEPVKRYG